MGVFHPTSTRNEPERLRWLRKRLDNLFFFDYNFASLICSLEQLAEGRGVAQYG